MQHFSPAVSRLFVVLILMALIPVAVADIYVSRDASGKLIYSDREPAGPHQRIRVEERPRPSSAPATAPDQSSTWRQQAQARDDRARKEEEERKASADEKAQRCAQARRQNAIYGFDGRKCDYDADGNRRCLSSAEIDAKRAEAKQLIAANCPPVPGA